MKRILLSILLMLCLIPAALADGPNVFVEEGAEGVPQEVIDQLAADYPGANIIHILHWTPPADGNIPAAPDDPNAVVLTECATLEDVALLSCAKGGTKTSLEDVPLQLEAQVITKDGMTTLTAQSLGIDGSVSILIPEGTVFTGPEEASPNNSREYRVRWYGRTGEYHTLLVLNSDPAGKDVTATWTQPIGIIVYAVNRLVSP